MQGKITPEVKEYIISNVGKVKQCDMARKFKVSHACISQIISGKRCKDIPVNELFFNVDSFLKQFNF